MAERMRELLDNMSHENVSHLTVALLEKTVLSPAEIRLGEWIMGLVNPDGGNDFLVARHSDGD